MSFSRDFRYHPLFMDRVWMVRAGRGGDHVEEFREQSLVAIGWNDVGPLTRDSTDEDIDRLFQEKHHDRKEGWRRTCAGQVKRFLRELAVGDLVCTYDPNKRIYLVGKLASEAGWRHDHSLGRTRHVDWTHQVFRDSLSVSTRNTLGGATTLFRLSEEASEELLANRVPLGSAQATAPSGTTEVPPDDAPESILHDEVVERAEQFIEDKIAALGWEDLQHLVAGLLRAMGYKTRVSERGPDRGVDIFASPDGLMLQEPRIFVEVKHRTNTSIGAPEIRSFLGGRSTGDRCLYVSSGGFTKEGYYEAERSSIPVTLINLPQLREILVDQYENLDADTRALVRLTRVYWPA